MIFCCHGRKQKQQQFENICRHVPYYRFESTIEHFDKTNYPLYKNKFLASAMMLHYGDAISVETRSFVVETEKSLFQEIEWHRTVASPWNSLCKTYILYT
jgi:hypothetical protein